MYKLFTVIFLVGGAVLLSFGLMTFQARDTDLSRFVFSIEPANAKWLLVGGAVLLVLGLAATFRPRKEVA